MNYQGVEKHGNDLTSSVLVLMMTKVVKKNFEEIFMLREQRMNSRVFLQG